MTDHVIEGSEAKKLGVKLRDVFLLLSTFIFLFAVLPTVPENKEKGGKY